MLTLNTLRRRLLLAGSCALLGILTACGGTADVNGPRLRGTLGSLS